MVVPIIGTVFCFSLGSVNCGGVIKRSMGDVFIPCFVLVGWCLNYAGELKGFFSVGGFGLRYCL